jgi:hypothetical protein
METNIVMGATLTVISALILAITFIGARDPKKPWWGGEAVMISILPCAIYGAYTGLALLALGFVFNFDMLGSKDIAISLTLLGAGTAILLLMRIPKRLAAFEAAKQGTQQQEGKSYLALAGGK